MPTRAFTNVLCRDVGASAAFYTQLLGLKEHFSSDWFVILTDPYQPGFEFGLLQQDHDIVPPAARGPAAGAMLTFVVSDCDLVHGTAVELGAEVIEEPTDMPYGQRRMILRDPNGMVVDISAPTAPPPSG